MLTFLRSLFIPSEDGVYTPNAVNLFMDNSSVPRAAAMLGYGGDTMVTGQRFIETEIRSYIRELEDEIASLRRENAQLQAALEEGN